MSHCMRASRLLHHALKHAVQNGYVMWPCWGAIHGCPGKQRKHIRSSNLHAAVSPYRVHIPLLLCREHACFMQTVATLHVDIQTYTHTTQMSRVAMTDAYFVLPCSLYTKNVARSNSFQARSLPRGSEEAGPEHGYVVDNSGEADGRNHMYDEPSVRWSSSNRQSSGGGVRIGSSSENSNTEGYNMLHPDDEENQTISPAVSPVQQTQFPPQQFTNRSLMSGVTASSFTQVTTVPSLKSSESGLYAEVQDNDMKASMQGGTPNVSSLSINGPGGTQRQPGVWYHESGDNPMPAYSLSQPIYHLPKEPVAYLEPSPWRSRTDAASKGNNNCTPVRRTASQLQNGHVVPQLPSGLRTALV